jgi:glucosamine-6-phosphate deaminase
MEKASMDLISTLTGSALESFFPAGWDLSHIETLAGKSGTDLTTHQPWWHPQFQLVSCATVADFDTLMGHEMAIEILRARQAGRELAMILPVGPMGMYRWTVYFLKEWNVPCDHVHGFNMDEWSDRAGTTLPGNHPGAFQNAMEHAFYGPLGALTVPLSQRNYATPQNLPTYAEKIAALKAKGAKLITVFGIGRVCHIAFWEPQFAGEYATEADWKAATHRLGAKLHPLTIEQNAITSFKSRTTLVPAFANTIGPGLFLQSDSIIGGADGILGRGMQWQGLSLRMTLLHKPTPWIPSSYMPTMAGRLFHLAELAAPLDPECN